VTLGSDKPQSEDRRTGLGAAIKAAAHPSPTISSIRIVVGPQNVRVAHPPRY